mgnify:CR=1 FL=1
MLRRRRGTVTAHEYLQLGARQFFEFLRAREAMGQMRLHGGALTFAHPSSSERFQSRARWAAFSHEPALR